MISIMGSLSKGWIARELNVSFDRAYYFNLEKRNETDRLCYEYAAQKLSDLNIFYTESNLGQFEYFSKDQILVGGIQPNMILGMLVGAEFIPHNSMDADISMTVLKGKNPNELPDPESLVEFDLIQLFVKQIEQVKSESRLKPIPPFFWDASGRATIHGTLTTAQKFLGEDIFLDLMTKPETVLNVMDWITESFIVLTKHFSDMSEIPIASVHIGECSGCMVSAEMFEHFVVPQTSRISRAFGPLRFHTCGTSDHLLKSIKTISNLESLDLGGGTSIAKVREIFGDKLPIDIAPLPADLSADSPEPILIWAKRVCEENGDGHLQILYHLEPDYKIENVSVLNEFVNGL
jgi:hypothetical protein